MVEIERRITDRCKKLHRKIGGTFLLALSGGADSCALFHAFRLAGVPFEAAHCNFNLRGEESLRDKEFVVRLCSKFDVPLHLIDFDTEKEKIPGDSIEMTCRRLRYDYFFHLFASHGFSRIATAHNLDDNAETFFLNMLRGSGVKGLKGMVTDNLRILRPLLRFSRCEILEFLDKIDADFVTDSTNLESDYRRNFLRNEVFPLLRSRWEGFDKAISNTMRLLHEDYQIEKRALSMALEDIDRLLPWETLDSFPSPETLIYRFIEPHGGTTSIAREISSSIDLGVAPGKKWKLDDPFEVVITREGILIENILVPVCLFNSEKYVWEKIMPSDLDMQSVRRASLDEVYLPMGEEHYDWVKADREMRIASLGMKGSQSVWKILKDAGLTIRQRENFEVLVSRWDRRPVWMPGLKRARVHLIDPSSDKPIYHLIPNE